MQYPTFRLKQNGKRIAVNPSHVTAVYEDSENVTDIYTLDCARSADAWDVHESFDSVLTKLDINQGKGAIPPRKKKRTN